MDHHKNVFVGPFEDTLVSFEVYFFADLKKKKKKYFRFGKYFFSQFFHENYF